MRMMFNASGIVLTIIIIMISFFLIETAVLVKTGRAVGSREDVVQKVLEEEEEQKKGSNEPLLGKVAKSLARIY